MFKRLSFLSILIISLSLSACGPSYITKNEYVPPSSPAALTEYTQKLEIYTVEQERYFAEKRECEAEIKRLEMDYDVYRDTMWKKFLLLRL